MHNVMFPPLRGHKNSFTALKIPGAHPSPPSPEPPATIDLSLAL